MKVDLGITATFVNNATSGLNSVKRDIDGVSQSAGHAENRLRAIQVVLASIITAKAFEWGKSFLETAGALEKMRMQLGITFGPGAQAEIDKVRDKFSGIGSNTEKIVQAFIRFQQVGMPIKQAHELTEAIVRMAVASGKGGEGVELLGVAFARAFGQGVVPARVLLQTIHNELPLALGVIATGMGDKVERVSQLLDEVHSHTLTGQALIEAAIAGAAQRLPNVITLAKRTILGALEEIKDAWLESIDKLTKDMPINMAIVTRLEAMRKVVDDFVKSITVADVNRFFDTLDKIAAGALAVGRALAPLILLVITLGTAAADLLSHLPGEALASGIIGYLFFGRIGAVVAASVMTVSSKLFGDVKTETNSFISHVESVAPLGLIAFALIGAKPALVITAVAAMINQSIEAARNMVDKLIGSAPADKQSRMPSIGNLIATGLGVADEKGQKLKRTLTEITHMGIMDKEKFLSSSTGTGAEIAIAAKQGLVDFVKELNALSPAVQSPAVATNALNVYLFHFKNLAGESQEAAGKLAGKALEVAGALGQSTGAAREQVEAIAKANQVYQQGAKAQGDINKEQGAQLKINKEAEASLNTLTKATQDLAIARANTKGDTYQAQQIAITKATQDQQSALRTLLLTFQEWLRSPGAVHSDKYEAVKAAVKEISNVQQQTADVMKDQLDTLEKVHNLETQRLINEQKINQLRIEGQTLDLQNQYNNNTMFNIGAGTEGGQIILQVQRERLQLNQQILQTENEIIRLQEVRNKTVEPALLAQIDETISKYQALGAAAKKALDGLTEASVAQRQLWQAVGSAIQTSMSDALVGIITRTKSWKQVGMDLFMSLTRAAANYIVKLVMIKAFSGVMGGGGLGGGAGLLGGLFGAANGAAFPGGVRMFANGGIIGGPTLFGMAGEAGPEAIMPLKNVGGKLGVAANGGGGNMTINIQAIDTQTGVMFLMKNLDTIQAGLQHRNKLNTGARQIP